MTHTLETAVAGIIVCIFAVGYWLGRDLENVNTTLMRIAVGTETLTRLVAYDRLGTQEQRGSLTLEYQESINLIRDRDHHDFLDDFLDREIGRQLAEIILMADP